jgi:formate C-acetyltransferase
MIKCNEIVKLYNNLASTYYGGFPITQALQLGGFLPNGNDATNELSNIILDAEMLVALPQPDLAVLWTNRMDSNYLEKAVQVIPKSMKPKFFNAHVGMQHLLSLGADLTEARNYAFAGCVESTIAGKTWHWANAGSVNLVKCLELTFTRGVDHSTGERLGKDTGALSKFSNFEDFYAAFSEQVKNATKLLVNALHCVETAHRDLVPLPYESLLVRDCIDKGRDLHQGGAKFNLTGIQGVGLATTADSLFAIKRSVFEEKKFTLKQLLEMVQRDWEGKEAERQYVLHKIDKYGNDEDEVDSIAGKIVDTYCKGVAEFKNLRGGPFVPGLFSVSTHVPFGFNVLSFDGRKKNDPLSDGCSPSQGRASKGPTAVAASLAKLDHAAVINGTLLNAKFNSMALSEHETIKKLSKFVGAFMRMDGFHLQINLINPAMLREAIDHPERHPNLLVRVAAYVALFSQLSREIQEEILSRSELGL